jgi:phage shock protein E
MPSKITVCITRSTDVTKIFLLLIAVAAVIMIAGCIRKAPAPVKPRSVIIDVRTPAEQQETGYIMGAVLIEHTAIADEIKKAVPDTRTPIVLYCRSGRRAETAKGSLNSLGYKDVTNLGGLEDAAKALSIPVVKVK